MRPDESSILERVVTRMRVPLSLSLPPLQKRIRREMRAVERPDAIPDEPADEDEDRDRLTGTGKEIKKLVRKSDKTGVYESDDDDDNPYASVSGAT